MLHNVVFIVITIGKPLFEQWYISNLSFRFNREPEKTKKQTSVAPVNERITAEW